MGSEDHRFPCHNCGSDLRFDPGADQLICDHCGSAETIDHSPWDRNQAIKEQDFSATLRASTSGVEMEEARTSQCPNCGARIEFDGAVHSKECPYCATPVVTDTGATRQIKPRAVVPFELSEDAARQAMKDWLGRLWFAPNGLTEYARKGRKLSGVYTPCWTFDADTKTRYTGQRGIEYTTTRTVTRNGKRQTEPHTKVRWTSVSGRVARFFDDVLVVASTALPEKFRTCLGQWDLTRLEPYLPQYLAGFRAEAYTVSLEDGFKKGRTIMDRQIIRDIKFDIGGDRQRVQNIETKLNDVTFKHILVPVWLAAYKYRGRSFRFVVNGQSGQVAGERPWSIWKLTLAALLVAIIAGALGYTAAVNQG